MPDQTTIARARKDKREGKSPSTQAGEFVREEIEHVREGKHGARSAKQAIAIGLSKARRAGVDLPPKPGTARTTRKPARSAPSRKRSRATLVALKREGHTAASHTALSRQAHAAAGRRSAASRSDAAKKAARTKGPARRSAAARKGASTRKRKAAHNQ
ncbi:MAG: DNA-binding protein [Gammaproteobacteria bacterium]|nr:MAG: DNA-binding protein [Gammaproteobacteria bacterium]